jgi:TolB-like protein
MAKKSISIYYFLATLLILIVTIIIILWKPFDEEKELQDKSIAVLPFINDSPEETEMYFINGTMGAILNNLSKIEDLSVVSRTSIEQYRDNPKPIPQIAKEMNVSFVLEGSGQRYGNSIRLTLQLLDAKNDRYIWSEEYDREILDIKELFSIQSEVARLVAEQIEATVTHEEEKRIEKIPTSNQRAYDLYLRGADLVAGLGYVHLTLNLENLRKAEDLFRLALVYDPEFAQLYASIASIYYEKYRWETEKPMNYLDSVRLYVELALSYDDQLEEAYLARGQYHYLIGSKQKAMDDFYKVLELNPNNNNAFYRLAWLYNSERDFKSALGFLHKMEAVDRGPAATGTLIMLRNMYFMIGCYNQSIDYSEQVLELDHDSAGYLNNMALCQYFINRNTAEATKLLKRGFAIDPDNIQILSNLAEIYFDLGFYREALGFVEKKNEELIGSDIADQYQAFLTGFIYKKNGNDEKAHLYFNQQIDYCEKLIDMEPTLHMQLAFAYAGLDNRDKAMENLRKLNQMENTAVYVQMNMQDDHYLECIQNDPEFQEIRSEIIAKYQAEHERVRQWLEDNDML